MEYAYLGANVRRLRLARGMSQATLATAAHVPQSYVSLIEHGLTPWQEQHITRFADALGVGRDVLTDAPIELAVRERPDSNQLRALAV